MFIYGKSLGKDSRIAFSNALNNYQQILSLPIYASLSDEDVNYVCDQVISVASEWI